MFITSSKIICKVVEGLKENDDCENQLFVPLVEDKT